ncbi:membrane-spanning 4-domains subfamily A member 15-like [Polypterus senegalus]|uniref:membrane-spanning 4-domains subfamily A member 15-like n=1 Tax=Polypterus senegalus TaxID=55291 RepID=UPI00196404CD|nr:membrane-spanning 4-domains subfamily A member 15-like [Polypterus senegalus]XP_039596462.1 membrane-spanning 4-domains subfamily A member 15-like [Polypterus senegalus]
MHTPERFELSPEFQLFLKGQPLALGVVQIMIGINHIVFGAVLGNLHSYAVYCKVPHWASSVSMCSGYQCLAAIKNPTSKLIKIALFFNIIAVILSAAAIALYLIDLMTPYPYQCSSFPINNSTNTSNCLIIRSMAMIGQYGIAGALLTFSCLEFCVATVISYCGIKAVSYKVETTGVTIH